MSKKYAMRGHKASWPLFSEHVATKNKNVVLETRTTKHDDSHDNKQKHKKLDTVNV